MNSPDKSDAAATVPRLSVFLWTAPWVLILIGLLIFGGLGWLHISDEISKRVRSFVAICLVILAVVGVLRALDLVGKRDDKPWYTIGFLVALVLFWGLCPPAWFFTEYYLLDIGALEPPSYVVEKLASAADEKAKSDIHAAFLAETKIYSDLASKVWLAVGAALATIIGFVKK